MQGDGDVYTERAHWFTRPYLRRASRWEALIGDGGGWRLIGRGSNPTAVLLEGGGLIQEDMFELFTWEDVLCWRLCVLMYNGYGACYMYVWCLYYCRLSSLPFASISSAGSRNAPIQYWYQISGQYWLKWLNGASHYLKKYQCQYKY